MEMVVEFAHERLQAYGVAREFVAIAGELLAGLPRGESSLADQLRRASDSVLLNLAEGAGRRAGRDKARYFVIARGSATECVAILDILRLRQLADPARVGTGRALLHRLVCMLTALATRAAGSGP